MKRSTRNLRKTMDAVPAGKLHDGALAKIDRLDCANPDKALPPCGPAAPPPLPGVTDYLQEAASDEDYSKALAEKLKSVVCARDDDSIFVLRGVSREGVELISRLAATDFEAPGLIDFIMSPACPVSAALTNEDKAQLLRIKQKAIKKPEG